MTPGRVADIAVVFSVVSLNCIAAFAIRNHHMMRQTELEQCQRTLASTRLSYVEPSGCVVAITPSTARDAGTWWAPSPEYWSLTRYCAQRDGGHAP